MVRYVMIVSIQLGPVSTRSTSIPFGYETLGLLEEELPPDSLEVCF